MRRSMAVGRRGPGLLGTMARTAVVAGTATVVAGGITDAKRSRANEQATMSNMAAQQQQLQAQQEALAQQQQRLAMQQNATPAQAVPHTAPASAGGLTQDSMALLQQLAEMQKQGIVTPEEFAQQKARILGS
ncbi:MAG: SHOCT domain-containing protein [Ktedonobacterales bacterium]